METAGGKQLSGDSLFDQTDAIGLAAAVARRDISPHELVNAAIDRIERVNDELNAVVIEGYEESRRAALEPLADGLLSGVPIVLKDLYANWSGLKSVNGSRYFKDFIVTADNLNMSRIRAAGMLVVGKTNVPENGNCVITDNLVFGPTLNPWHAGYSPGGSSGGSAALVASRALPLAHASDGGGSIRIPASNSGVFGLKPSRGRVCWEPDMVDLWYGSALENNVSLSVRDSAAFLDVISGVPSWSPYRAPPPETSFLDAVGRDTEPLKIGVVTGFSGTPTLSSDVARSIKAMGAICEGLGHALEPATLSIDADDVWSTMERVASVLSARSYTAMMEMGLPGPTAETLTRASWWIYQNGKAFSAEQHAADYEHLRRLGRTIAMDMAGYDLLMLPVQFAPPPKIGDVDMMGDVQTFMRGMSDRTCFTQPFNIAGMPSMSIPGQMSDNGLPIGVQFVAPIYGEERLYSVAAQLEAVINWGALIPSINAMSQQRSP